MLKLYGNSLSRAMRCMWMLEEMGLPFELVKKTTRPEDLQSAEYLRLNPNGRIPTLVDGSVVIWESMAINLYLAQKYDGPLHITKPEVLGVAAQWSFWAMLETEALLLELLMHRAMLPEFGPIHPTRNATSCCCKDRCACWMTHFRRAAIWRRTILPSPISTSPAFSPGAK